MMFPLVVMMSLLPAFGFLVAPAMTVMTVIAMVLFFLVTMSVVVITTPIVTTPIVTDVTISVPSVVAAPFVTSPFGAFFRFYFAARVWSVTVVILFLPFAECFVFFCHGGVVSFKTPWSFLS